MSLAHCNDSEANETSWFNKTLASNSRIDNVNIVTEARIIGNYTTHDLLVLIAIVSTSIALILSIGQILFHATHYHIPEQQRR